MTRKLLLIIAMMLSGLLLRAQVVVMDPSQIAASAANAAEQVDYMINQLGELAEMGNRLDKVKRHIDNVFGEDGVGGKTISILNDLGTLNRLTEAFHQTLKRTEEYSRMMEEMKRYRLSDANLMLMYIGDMKHQAELAVEVARKILSTLGLSKKEKKDEIESIIGEMEADLAALDRMVDIEISTTLAAEGMDGFIRFLDDGMTVGKYAESRKPFGTITSAGRGTMGVLGILTALLGILSGAYGMLIYVRDGLEGDATADNIFLRIAAGTVATLIMLALLSQAAGLNL